jgi:putative nucleotidyltransferase with HDIG domain
MRVAYRLGQFWQLIHPSPLPAEVWREIGAVLAPAEVELFRRFSAGDRQHSYRVMRLLRAAGDEEPALLAAALLHDVGKTRLRNRLWERVLGTLGEQFFPQIVGKWGSSSARGWRRPFAVRVQHAEWGAEMAEEAGSSPLVVSLIRRHQEKELGHLDAGLAGLLRRLQWADEQH